MSTNNVMLASVASVCVVVGQKAETAITRYKKLYKLSNRIGTVAR